MHDIYKAQVMLVCHPKDGRVQTFMTGDGPSWEMIYAGMA